MIPNLLLFSPGNLHYLGVTIQSLVATCLYSDFRAFLLKGAQDGEDWDAFCTQIADDRFVPLTVPDRSLHGVGEAIMPDLDDSSLTILCPPGSVFLRESWLDELLISTPPEIALGGSHFLSIDSNEGEIAYPSLDGVLFYRVSYLRAIGGWPETLSFFGSDLYLFLKACQRGLGGNRIPSDWFHIYSGAMAWSNSPSREESLANCPPVIRDLLERE